MLTQVFKPDEAKAALEKLEKSGLVESVQKRNHSEKYFEDLVQVIDKLSNDNKMPRIVVASLDIFRIPKPDTEDLDNLTVAARMNVMERKMEGMDKNMTELLKNFKSMVEKSETPPLLNPALGESGGQALGPVGYAQAVVQGADVGRKQLFRKRISSKRNYEEMNDNSTEKTEDTPEQVGQGNWI